jgi:hypothetical protein
MREVEGQGAGTRDVGGEGRGAPVSNWCLSHSTERR